MDFQTIHYEKPEPGLVLVTLDRPDRMNAWTYQMMEELIQAFQQADADDEVRVVIITGAGRAYCAGADLDPDMLTRQAAATPPG